MKDIEAEEFAKQEMREQRRKDHVEGSSAPRSPSEEAFPPSPTNPDAFQIGLETLKSEIGAKFTGETEDYLRYAYQSGASPGLTSVRLVLGAFKYGGQTSAPDFFRRLVEVVGPTEIRNLESRADLTARRSPEAKQIAGGATFATKIAKSILREAWSRKSRWETELEPEEVFKTLRLVKPKDCQSLHPDPQSFWEVFEDWVHRADKPKTRSEPLPSTEAPSARVPDSEATPPKKQPRRRKSSVFVDREFALKQVEDHWDRFVRLHKWSRSVSASLDRLQGIRREMIEKALTQNASGKQVAVAHVPFRISSKAIFLSMLANGAEELETNPKRESDSAGALARLLAIRFNKSSAEFSAMVVRALSAEALRVEREGNAYALLSPQLEESINYAQTLADTISDRIVATRHLLVAFLDPQSLPDTAPIGIDTGKEGISLIVVVEELRKYLASNERVRSVDQVDAWNPILERIAAPNSPAALQRSTSVPAGPGGGWTRMSRYNSLALRTEETAGVIAAIFRMANLGEEKRISDFVFALYGEWGRGKSTLIEKVSDKLSVGSGPSSPAYASVEFSAWKYPTRPEVWVHLYESIRRTAVSDGFLQKIRISFRLGILEAGWFPLSAGVTMLAVTRLPLAEWAQGLWMALGWAGCLLLATFALRASNIGKLVVHRYFSPPDHADKLGMQAVIGLDLQRLLSIWIKPIHRGTANGKKGMEGIDLKRIEFSKYKRGWWALLFVTFATLAGIGGMIYEVYEAHEKQEAAVVRAKAEAELRVKAAETETTVLKVDVMLPIEWTLAVARAASIPKIPAAVIESPTSPKWVYAALGLLAVAVIAFPFLVGPEPKRFQHLLLIVDDLDRCDPAQMLAVIESLRLFLDDDSMRRRLQMAMLMDRRLLEIAVWQRASVAKYAPLGEREKRRFLKMQREKLFMCELELPHLNEKDLNDLLGKILPEPGQKEMPTGSSKTPPAPNAIPVTPTGTSGPPKNTSTATKNVIVVTQQESKNEKKSVAASQPEPIKPEDVVLTPVEQEALRDEITSVPPGRLTPRSVAMIKVRFQLARLLLRDQGMYDPITYDAAKSIAARIVKSFIPDLPPRSASLDPSIERILSHVTCDTDPVEASPDTGVQTASSSAGPQASPASNE